MRKLQDSTKQYSDGYFSGKDRGFEPSVEWEEVEFAQYRQNKDIDFKLIKLANEKNSLFDIFPKYNIKFTEVYSPSGWTHKTRCPFKDHRDSSPSFGYNSEQKIFNCFGCQRNGGIVQFISFMENKPQIEVAKNLLKTSTTLTNIIENIANEPEDDFDETLLEFSSYVRNFLEKYRDNPKASSFIEAITWNLDVYLMKNVMIGSVKIENLKIRIKKLKEHIESFE